ncbi:hypothetical protein CCR97_29350 [Rhodoplanes elegans]|uniref:Putative restriction endonuclease domain-containing protein n=2 Tax=Rhodoplanes elegans TaxID=29408 RepID=A0A327KEQ1_9BRAD|nr:hypothetical protein [Rhodoplanes elegans]RAI37269.1 hypothetical protein CH338_16330 [Rhodoplanes elegans]
MGVPRISTGPMTIEAFYAFTDTRPDDERWELIEGEPVMNAAASPMHQWIVKNLLFALTQRERAPGATWRVLSEVGLRISDLNRPEPDVVILPGAVRPVDLPPRHLEAATVAFEVLSPTTADRDLRWKRNAYTTLPSLTHYVVIAQDAFEVVVFARDSGFAEQRLSGRDDAVVFPALGIILPLAEIFRDTGL